MTKQSAIVMAGGVVLALMAGVAARDLTQRPPTSPTQIVVQFGPGGTGAPTTTVPTTVPTRTGEGG